MHSARKSWAEWYDSQGWPAIAKLVLPAASTAHHTIAGVIDSLQAPDGGAGGLTALQLAVRSGSNATVRVLLDWARSGGARWAVASGGLRGITSMHLAALLHDDGEVGALLRGARTNRASHATHKPCFERTLALIFQVDSSVIMSALHGCKNDAAAHVCEVGAGCDCPAIIL